MQETIFIISHVVHPAVVEGFIPAALRLGYQVCLISDQGLAGWPDDCHPAPRPHLRVRSTLSVRTLQLADHPDTHIKLPLAMRTLGARNLRLIKPSTPYDGHRIDQILMALAETDPVLKPLYTHADESCGGHVGEAPALCFLLRRYPGGLEDAALCPVASLGAVMGDGRPYLQHLLEWCAAPDIPTWWREYVRLLARVHLRLWLKYGTALESNQQNAVVAFRPGQPLSLVMKDNDAARLWPARFNPACPELADLAAGFLDRRILVNDELPLAQMFTTITLQLDMTAILEWLAEFGLLSADQGREILVQELSRALEELDSDGVETASARQMLFDAPRQWVKYLLLAGSLLPKSESRAADINKYYGLSGPNFLRGRA